MAFSENLKYFRKSKRLSQNDIAQSVGVSQPMIAQYERGMKVPNIVTGVALAKLLDTTCEELINGTSRKDV